MSRENRNTQIYIGGINRNISKADIRKEFSEFGKIYDIIIRKHFAFVQYSESTSCRDAINQMDGRSPFGEKLLVQYANNRNEDRGGRYRDRDDRRGRSPDRDRFRDRGRAGPGGPCFNCGQPGHFARECPKKYRSSRSRSRDRYHGRDRRPAYGRDGRDRFRDRRGRRSRSRGSYDSRDRYNRGRRYDSRDRSPSGGRHDRRRAPRGGYRDRRRSYDSYSYASRDSRSYHSRGSGSPRSRGEGGRPHRNYDSKSRSGTHSKYSYGRSGHQRSIMDDEYSGRRARSHSSGKRADRRQGSNSRSAPNRVNNDNDFDSRDHNGEFRGEEQKYPDARENGVEDGKSDRKHHDQDAELNPEKQASRVSAAQNGETKPADDLPQADAQYD